MLVDRSKLFCLTGLCDRGCKLLGPVSLLPDDTADTAGLSDLKCDCERCWLGPFEYPEDDGGVRPCGGAGDGAERMPGLPGSRLCDLIRSELGLDRGTGDGYPGRACGGGCGLPGDSDGLWPN